MTKLKRVYSGQPQLSGIRQFLCEGGESVRSLLVIEQFNLSDELYSDARMLQLFPGLHMYLDLEEESQG
jgi:hypothetical protein